MSKKNAILKANKRILNESMPPLINFDEYEVYSIINEIFNNEIPPEVIAILQRKLKEKGRNFNTKPTPPGAYN